MAQPASMVRLALFLFGSPRIERDGELVEVDTRKATALLAYLAVSRQRHSRDALAALLWPDYDQSHARATLRRTLSALNKALNGDWLAIDREAIGLSENARLWLDVEEFAQLLTQCRTHGHAPSQVCPTCLQPLSQAVALYHDDFMVGFGLRDSSAFDTWQFFQADSLRRDQSSALERLVRCYSEQEDYEAAITYARRWLALDRLHEPAHYQLMQLYAWAGNRASALHQYRECVQVLDSELGVAPLESTTQLYQAIKENQVLPPVTPRATSSPLSKEAVSGPLSLSEAPSATVAQPPLPNAGYPLVGRASEWTTLRSTYKASKTGSHLVILEGEAGIGKTRLAEELLTYARSKGADVVAARCYEGETGLAYGPIVEGLRTILGQKSDAHWLENVATPWLTEAARLLPELAILRPGLPPAPPLESPGAQSRFFEGIRQVLLAAASAGNGEYPGVIFFDDLQWADEASLDLLTYIVRRLRETSSITSDIAMTTARVSLPPPTMILLAWRGKQSANHSRLHSLLIETQRAGNTTVLSLSRLSQLAVRELVQTVTATGSPSSSELSERLYQETEGLPYFLVEYLTAMAKGVLNTENADWSLPGGVRDLLHSRLLGVDEIGWQLLNTAAIIGRFFDFDTLREVSGRGEEETVTALEDLIAQGLVEEVREGSSERSLTYDFGHEKLRTLVYEETSLARRRLLHRRVAEVLAGWMHGVRGRREGSSFAGQIAHHYIMAGNEASAAEYFKLAGEYARTLYAHKEALAHFSMALALGHAEAAALHEDMGDLYTLLGKYSAALKSYETAAALCKPDALASIEHKLGNVYQRRGEWERAEAHFEAALEVPGEADPAAEEAEHARVYADWSLNAYHRGELEKALKLAQEGLKLSEETHDIHALAQAHNILGILTSHQQNMEEAEQHLKQSLALAESLHDPGIRVAALNNLALAYGTNGETEQAITLTETALALCVSQGDRHREAALHSNLADLLHDAGRTEEAMAHLKQSVSIFAEIGVEAGTHQPEIWKLVEW